MAVYVDHLFTAVSRDPEAKRVGSRNGHKWSHMWTTPGNEEELHALAARIGMRPEWFQAHSSLPHYDLVPSRRARAVAAGAVEVNLMDWMRVRRDTTRSTSVPVDGLSSGGIHPDDWRNAMEDV